MVSNDPMRKDPEQWFLDAHPERGTLRVQVSTGRGLFPVEGARVEIYRNFGPERTVFYEGALPENLLRPLAGKYGLLY